MPKVTEAHFEAGKKQIFDAAATCFSKKGFHKCTMQDICKAAKLSPGAVYRYFKGKEEIIEAMVDENRQRAMAFFDETKDNESGLHALHEIMDMFFKECGNPKMRDCMRLGTELWAEALTNKKINKMLRNDLDKYINVITKIVSKAQKSGELRSDLDPKAVVRVVISFFNGLQIQRNLDPKIDIGSYVAVVKTMMHGLMSKEK